jgi:hypothetical protein
MVFLIFWSLDPESRHYRTDPYNFNWNYGEVGEQNMKKGC